MHGQLGVFLCTCSVRACAGMPKRCPNGPAFLPFSCQLLFPFFWNCSQIARALEHYAKFAQALVHKSLGIVALSARAVVPSCVMTKRLGAQALVHLEHKCTSGPTVPKRLCKVCIGAVWLDSRGGGRGVASARLSPPQNARHLSRARFYKKSESAVSLS